MDPKPPVRCVDNEEVALYLRRKRQEMAENPNGLSENLDMTLSTAYRNICGAKTPIKTLKDLSQIKGIGKWILRLMKGFFPEISSDVSPSKEPVQQKGKKMKGPKVPKGPKRYLPQKNSVAYALLITLYRAMANGSGFMKKQELIDAAEASGLSRTSIAQDKSKGKPGQFGSSPRDWYTGWNCMKTLVLKGLVVKSSCPAKYMLTQEGQDAARDCLSRSGLGDPSGNLTLDGGSDDSLERRGSANLEPVSCASAHHEIMLGSVDLSYQVKLNDITNVVAERNLQIGQVSPSYSDSAEFNGKNRSSLLIARSSVDIACSVQVSADSARCSSHLRPCSSFGPPADRAPSKDITDRDINLLAMPPFRAGEKFEKTYDVILILDDRENFGSRSRKVLDNIRSQFGIFVEVRRLPVGDGIWIARHRQLNEEYVLDFIVERKKVDDLCSSIRDNRYRDQKLRLQKCGLRKLIYLVEGDPNSLEAAESIKTACFTTEILEGFDVQRTSGFADTVRKYSYLTQSITQYYSSHLSYGSRRSRVCPSFDEFVKKCQDLEKITVSDVFALQLMQVPQVTEEIALAVIAIHPTLLSLARAYSQHEGDIRAQQDMLKIENPKISGVVSRNIFKLVWGT